MTLKGINSRTEDLAKRMPVDWKATFGKIEFLSTEKTNKFDDENKPINDVFARQVVIFYSEKLGDDYEVVIPTDYEVQGVEYGDEIEFLGEVSAMPFEQRIKNGNDFRLVPAFSVKADGFKKAQVTQAPPKPKNEAENKVGK
ncbi:hypothetical protein RyT2_26520 [Pseudolactococcus yaeyamensis]